MLLEGQFVENDRFERIANLSIHFLEKAFAAASENKYRSRILFNIANSYYIKGLLDDNYFAVASRLLEKVLSLA